MIKGDAYRPHTYEEITAPVASEVAARLDRLKLYGVWWCNRGRSKIKQVSAIGRNGKEYVRRFESTPKPREEWVAVPVPDPGVPREWVDAAREAIKENRRPSSAGHRFGELSGGILRCGGCGYAMMTNSISSYGSKRFNHYYRCPKRLRDRGMLPAEKLAGRQDGSGGVGASLRPPDEPGAAARRPRADGRARTRQAARRPPP